VTVTKVVQFLLLSSAALGSVAGVAAVAAVEQFGAPMTPKPKTPHDPAAIPVLIEQLSAADAASVSAIVETLQALSNDPATRSALADEFRKALRGDSDQLKLRIVDIIRGADARAFKEMLPPIVNGLESNDVKAATIRAMGESTPEPHTQQEILRIAGSAGSPEVIKEAAMALGRWRNVESIPLLIQMLSNENEGVKSHAFWALQNISGNRYTMEPARWTAWLDSVKQSEPAKLTALIAKLDYGPDATRPLAAEKMASIVLSRDKAVEALRRHLADPDFRTRAACINVMWQFGDAASCADLIPCLRDTQAEVSYTAWRALKDISGKNLPRDHAAWANWLSQAH
jgi:HEAT repeat protein